MQILILSAYKRSLSPRRSLNGPNGSANSSATNFRPEHRVAAAARAPYDGGRGALLVEAARYPARHRRAAAAIDGVARVPALRQPDRNPAIAAGNAPAAFAAHEARVLVAMEEELD